MTQFPQYQISDWYEPNQDAVQKIKQAGKITVVVAHGTWCGDCEYTMPLFKKILTQLNLDNTELIDLDLDRTKKDAAGLTVKYNITRIPTLVLLKDGIEIHRIVEYPVKTIEEDFAEKL